MTNFSRKILSATLALLLVAEQLMTGVLAFSDLGSVDGAATDPAPVVVSADVTSTDAADTTSSDPVTDADTADTDATADAPDQTDVATGATADSADADTTTADVADQTDVATGATADTADTADQDTATDTADQADTTTGADTVLDGADDALLTPLAATTPLFSMMTRAAQGGSVKVDVATRTAAGETPRTEYRVGEQIETNAIIDNSGLGGVLDARARITIPKAHLTGQPTVVEERSMRDFAVTDDADNRYYDFKIKVQDGVKLALPIYFTLRNRSTVPNGFETPVKFEIFDLNTDDLLDEHTTNYIAKVRDFEFVMEHQNYYQVGTPTHDWGRWTTDADGNPRLTKVDQRTTTSWSGYTAPDPVMENYTGWVEAYLALKPVGNLDVNTPGQSMPGTGKFVLNLPAGSKPQGVPNRDGLYCYTWHRAFCWTYDADSATMTYE